MTMKPNLLATPPPGRSEPTGNDAEYFAPAANSEVLTISQMAEKFGLTPRALRFYESKGLLAPAREGRGRIYTQADQRHLSLILKGRKLGFTIAEIGQMIAAETGHAAPHTLQMTREKCLEQIAHLEKQLQETTEALAELRRMHLALSQ
jgi:DNA-binding transcriptional MerR regulator